MTEHDDRQRCDREVDASTGADLREAMTTFLYCFKTSDEALCAVGKVEVPGRCSLGVDGLLGRSPLCCNDGDRWAAF